MIPIGKPLPFGRPRLWPVVSTMGRRNSFIVTSMIIKSTNATQSTRPAQSMTLEFPRVAAIGLSPGLRPAQRRAGRGLVSGRAFVHRPAYAEWVAELAIAVAPEHGFDRHLDLAAGVHSPFEPGVDVLDHQGDRVAGRRHIGETLLRPEVA